MQDLESLDARAFEAVNGSAPHLLVLAALALSALGGAAGMAGWLGLLAWIRRAEGIAFCTASVALAAASAWVLKHALPRERPWLALGNAIVSGPHETTGSFPSAHAAMSFALATAIALRWPRAGWFALPLAAAVALSRVILGMHYPGDVLAGSLLGAAAAGLLHRSPFP